MYDVENNVENNYHFMFTTSRAWNESTHFLNGNQQTCIHHQLELKVEPATKNTGTDLCAKNPDRIRDEKIKTQSNILRK